MDIAEMLVLYARMQVPKVGATTMDRPEWIAANPFAALRPIAL